MVDTTYTQCHKLKQARLPVKYFKCDNAGVDKKVQNRAQISDWKIGVNFQCPKRDNPHHNHIADLGLSLLSNKNRALMKNSNMNTEILKKYSVKYLE